ncbi:hypothetical protein O988_06359 [Pseudogymnoascus sp. VKM F-3808]|nr:hypothetical protein O988_06359 [Pseudogymnoascus sp. VKM F-3808]
MGTSCRDICCSKDMFGKVVQIAPFCATVKKAWDLNGKQTPKYSQYWQRLFEMAYLGCLEGQQLGSTFGMCDLNTTNKQNISRSIPESTKKPAELYTHDEVDDGCYAHMRLERKKTENERIKAGKMVLTDAARTTEIVDLTGRVAES